MKTTRTVLIAALGVLVMAPALLADVEIGAQLRITPRPRQDDLEVYVWPDRGMDAVYYPGENINVNVEVTRDAFLILYNIDTRGRLHILFPASPWDDNFVEAGDAISFPRRWDDVDWTIDGPPGTEYIQVIASEIPISPPEWPVYINGAGVSDDYYAPSELRGFSAGSDRYGYIDIVNRNICGRYYDWTATDVATFEVRNRPYHYNVDYIDPWPDVFYGQVYIGWPIGSRIYIDGIFIGIAPCYIPRHYVGRRIITCYDGPRLIRRHEVNCFPKRDYYSHNKYRGPREFVYRKARPDVYDHFQIEKGTGKKKYRVVERQKVGVYDDNGVYRSQSSTKRTDPSRIDNGAVIKRGKSDAPVQIDGKSKKAKSDPGFVIKREKPAPSLKVKDTGPRSKNSTEAVEKRDSGEKTRKMSARSEAPKVDVAQVDRGRDKVTAKASERREKVVVKDGSAGSKATVSAKRNSNTSEAKVKANSSEKQKSSGSSKRSKRDQ